ncbi:hypothetical protein VTO42DRAFT_5897 [Malbranchea cinnamomea]
MDGDLSLSQSFGGLRIANPDDNFPSLHDEPLGQTETARSDDNNGNKADSSATQYSTHTASDLSPSSTSPAQPQMQQPSNRLSQSYAHLDQQSSPRIPPSLSHNPDGSTSGYSVRPPSTYFPHESSSSPATRASSYRGRTESGASTASENIPRNDPRGGMAGLQPRLSVREANRSIQSHSSMQGPNGPLPPRRSSKVVHNSNISPLSGSYNPENAPLPSSEEWHERGAAVSIRQEVDASGKTVSRYIKKGVRDFSFGRTLGEGSYSTVMAATDRQTLKEYAIKILDKRHIIKEKKVKYVNIEKDTLNRLTDHPGVVRLYYTFQDERSLYFVLDLASNGELLGVLKRMTTFDEECTRFYGAQILDTIDYMHKRGVIHRDLKPENVLLDSHMHVKITDFGTAKILEPPKRPDDNGGGIPPMVGDTSHERASSFVGTAEYVSPELLTDKNACKASDLWAFGCIIFQLLSGRPPFKAGNEYQTFQKIVALDYEFPRGFPPVARDLVERLLVLDPASRLQMEHIKNHAFFEGITWGRGLWKQKAPRLKPYVPPPPEPIKLNGTSNEDSYPPNIMNNNPNKMNIHQMSNNPGAARPYPRVITDLPPPSQLDIEWSPVLNKANERILKLGNLTVSSTSLPGGSGDNDGPKKLSRFFGGAAAKKRPRLVLITSSGRVIVVPAGGEDKKPKLDISLLAPEVQYRSTTDMKGHSSWILETRDKRYIFEETKQGTSNDGAAAASIQEWVDTLDRAKETAQFHATPNTALAGDEDFRELQSGHADHSDDASRHVSGGGGGGGGRAALVKHQARGDDSDSVKGKKRFSRRHSKNGLSAIF